MASEPQKEKAHRIERVTRGMKLDREKRERKLAQRQQELEQSRAEQAAAFRKLPLGRVLTRARSGMLVEDDQRELHWCRVRHKGSRGEGMAVPGDHVHFLPSTAESDGVVEAIAPRKTLLNRWVFGRIKEIAANLEQLIIIATPREPTVSPRLVDRMLVGASVGGLEAIVVINKSDLYPAEELETWSEHWSSAGYRVLTLSAETGENIEQLEAHLRAAESLLAGASGVGKSTILNRIVADLEIDTAEISERTDRGVHTTTATQLYRLPGGGIVADTPGVREFFPVLDDPDELEKHFPDFAAFRDSCRWELCMHEEDADGCAVAEAVARGAIHPERYASYLLMRASLLEGPGRGRSGRQG